MSQTLNVLISCMHQKDNSIIERSNIQSDVVVVNQCDKDNREELIIQDKEKHSHRALLISTKERGLSKSRNMAISNSNADICLICDDDEILNNNYPECILKAFEDNPSADVIAFQIADADKKYKKRKTKINYFNALKLASWQLALKRRNVIKKNIKFDESLGSGVSKAGGEENKFIYDCLRNGLEVIYVPVEIGRMIEGQSQWFKGCNQDFFFDRGIMTKKLMGKGLASLYALYYLLSKYHWYKNDISFVQALQYLFKGIYSNNK